VACSPDEYPAELWQTEPPTEYVIAPVDRLYRAILREHVETGPDGDFASPAAFRVGEPQLSVNCSAFARPEHCEYPSPARRGFGAAELVSGAIDGFLVSESGVPTQVVFKVHHDPEECNKSHSIIGVYKSENASRAKGTEYSISSPTLKRAVRGALSERSRIVHAPAR
jgi:hypothetical protein